MVNNKLRLERQNRIKEIVKTLRKSALNNRFINKKDLVMSICVEYDVQQRKAAEYLRVAEYMIKFNKS